MNIDMITKVTTLSNGVKKITRTMPLAKENIVKLPNGNIYYSPFCPKNLSSGFVRKYSPNGDVTVFSKNGQSKLFPDEAKKLTAVLKSTISDILF